jgi:hypothetical protein
VDLTLSLTASSVNPGDEQGDIRIEIGGAS